MATITTEAGVTALAASPILDRLYTTEGPVPGSPVNASVIHEYDSVTGAPIVSSPRRTGENWADLYISADGSRVYATNQFGGIGDKPGGVSIFDPATWAVLDTFMPGAFPFQTVDAPSRRKSYTLMPTHLDGGCA